MRFKLVKDSKKLILCFLGYSFLPDSLKHLELGEYGLGVLYDYSDGDFSLDALNLRCCKPHNTSASLNLLSRDFFGKDIYLIAFSMGVFAANLAFNNAPVFNIKYALAINGTPLGIDELYGIKQSDFKSSMDNFNFALFKKGCFLKDLSRVDFGFNENAKAELNALYNAAINAPKQKSKIAWDKAIISKKDLIFPPKAVQNYFRNCEPKCALKSINAPHFAFYNFTTWEQILAL